MRCPLFNTSKLNIFSQIQMICPFTSLEFVIF